MMGFVLLQVDSKSSEAFRALVEKLVACYRSVHPSTDIFLSNVNLSLVMKSITFALARVAAAPPAPAAPMIVPAAAAAAEAGKIEVVAKEIPEMVKRIPESVVLTVVMLLVEVRRVFGHPMIVVVPPPLRIREKFVGSCDEDKLVLRIRCLVLVRVGFLDETSVGFFHLLLGCAPLDPQHLIWPESLFGLNKAQSQYQGEYHQKGKGLHYHMSL